MAIDVSAFRVREGRSVSLNAAGKDGVKCLEATSTAQAPWYVVPADDKKNARLIVSQVLLDTMRRLKMRYPTADAARVKELREIRKQLLK